MLNQTIKKPPLQVALNLPSTGTPSGKIPDGSSIYVEEVRTGQRTLTTKSLRKYKTGVNPSSFAKRISNAHGDTGTISIVTKDEIVKAQNGGRILNQIAGPNAKTAAAE